eukprot:1557139-Pleurochrysis_carterae.AAC.1
MQSKCNDRTMPPTPELVPSNASFTGQCACTPCRSAHASAARAAHTARAVVRARVGAGLLPVDPTLTATARTPLLIHAHL